MAATGTPTPNLGLRIPVGTDPASVDDINYNSNLLDTVLGAVGNTSVKDQLDELSDQIAKYYYGETGSSSLSPSTNGSITVPIPSGGTTVKAIIPYGFVPADHWNSQVMYTSVNNSTRTINFRVIGSGNAQVFNIKYIVVYI